MGDWHAISVSARKGVTAGSDYSCLLGEAQVWVVPEISVMYRFLSVKHLGNIFVLIMIFYYLLCFVFRVMTNTGCISTSFGWKMCYRLYIVTGYSGLTIENNILQYKDDLVSKKYQRNINPKHSRVTLPEIYLVSLRKIGSQSRCSPHPDYLTPCQSNGLI